MLVAHPVFPVSVCKVESAKHFLPPPPSISRGSPGCRENLASVPRRVLLVWCCSCCCCFFNPFESVLKMGQSSSLCTDHWCWVFHLSLEYKDVPNWSLVRWFSQDQTHFLTEKCPGCHGIVMVKDQNEISGWDVLLNVDSGLDFRSHTYVRANIKERTS